MPILESIRNKLQMAGMSTQCSLQKYPFNTRNSTSLLIHGINIVCSVGFIISGSKDLREFADSLFVSATAILIVVIFLNLNWKMKRLFKFLNNLEDTVDQSK